MTFREILKIIKNELSLSSIYIITSATIWLISLLLPYVTGRFIDQLVYGKNSIVIYRNAELLLILAIIELIATFYSRLFKTKLNNKLVFTLIFKIYKHLEMLPISYLNSIDKSYLTQRINQDVSQLISFILESGISLFFNTLSFVFVLILMIHINHAIFTLLCILIIIYYISYYIFKKPLYNKTYAFKESQNLFFAAMNDYILKVRSIKLNSWFDIFENNLQNKYNDLFESSVNYSILLYHFRNIDLLIKRLSNIVLFFYGGMLLIQGTITIGYFSMINIYFTMILSNLSSFLDFGKYYQDSLVSLERTKQILNTDHEKNGKLLLKQIDKIEFRNVTLSYKGKEIIHNLNLNLEIGNIYIVVGEIY